MHLDSGMHSFSVQQHKSLIYKISIVAQPAKTGYDPSAGTLHLSSTRFTAKLLDSLNEERIPACRASRGIVSGLGGLG